MKDNKTKQKQRKNRTPIIESFSPDLEYKEEKHLTDEAEALAQVVTTQQKTYRCVEINQDAKALVSKFNSCTVHLLEQIKAIEERLEERMPRSARIILLQNHNKLMKAAIAERGQIETALVAIEEDLYPTLDPQKHGALFLKNKSAVASLYARLKQRSFEIQFKLENIDPSLQNAIRADLERLQKLLEEIEQITEKTSEIYENLKGGRITSNLYADMANKVYEINKKKFDFEQVCKLIEDKLEISKSLDAEIRKQIKELKTRQQGLSAVKGIIDSVYHNTNRGTKDLATDLGSVNLSFNATDYEAKLLTSSMQWDDDLDTREKIIKERQNILAQLAEKRKYIAQVTSIIVTHQHIIKNLIAEDLEFCAKRTSLYEAFTNAPHEFYQRFQNYQKVLDYNFEQGIDDEKSQWYLHRLLTYTLGFSPDSPEDCIIVRHVRNTSRDIKKLKEQFEKDFPLLTEKRKFFDYDNKSYYISDTIRKNIEHYTLAHAKIVDAFETGEKSVSYTDNIDFKQELKTLRESKTEIEQYIVAYKKEKKNNRLDLLEVKSKLSKSVLKFTLQNDSLEYQGGTYVLDIQTKRLVEEYNLAHKLLSEDLNGEKFSVDPISFRDKKERFAALQENQKIIIAFLEEQRKNRLEFLEIKEKLSNLQKIILKENALPFEGANYVLDYTTQQMVVVHNYQYEQLAKIFNEFSLVSQPLNAEFLQKIKERFTRLEENQNNINAYLEEQRNRRQELLEIQKELSGFSLFTVNGTSLRIQERSYPLDDITEQRVDRYNHLHETLTNTLRDELSSKSISSKEIDLESLQKIRSNFTRLLDNHRNIVQFIEKQVEFGALIRDFSKYSHLTLNESGNLIYKEKTYLLNAGLKKQVQEYNKTYDQLMLAFQSSENVETIKVLLSELPQKSPLNKIDEFSELMESLQKQSALIQKRADMVGQVLQKINQEIFQLGQLYLSDTEENAKFTILDNLRKTFTEHNAEIDQLAASVHETQEALRLDNLEDSKKQLRSVAVNNKGKVDTLVQDLTNRFNEDLPKLSSGSYLNQFMEWIDKNIVAPVYEAYYKEEKPYKPGFFAASTEANLFTFRKNLLPGLEEFQKEAAKAAPAA
ncbi:hypothetical protein [Legionella sp. WA2022007384]